METNNKQENLDIFPQIGNEVPMNICALNQFITDKDLAIEITTFMKKIFKEYKGTSIYKNERNEIFANMFFSQAVNNGEQKTIQALTNGYVETNKGEWIDQLTNINSTLNGTVKPFVLTDKAKDIISKLIKRNGNEKINWNRVSEYRDGNPCQNYYSGGNSREIILKISNIDITKVLERIHGRSRHVEHDLRNPNHRVSYEVRLVKIKPATVIQYNYNPLMGYVPEGNQEMILQIIQYDDYVMNEVGNMVGFNPKVSDIVMY